MPNTKLNWPLAVSSFSLLDKLKIGWFLIREPIWTYGSWVRKYEEKWEKTLGCAHAIMVSSGSTANELIALRRKWELQQAGEWPRRNKVIFPVNTWISSVSVWINLGFEPVFVDVSPINLNVTKEGLASVLASDNGGFIGTVFYTALLGYFNDLNECKSLTEAHGARFLMDNCEASFSYFVNAETGSLDPIINFVTCSTSVFFSHFTSSGTEGGLIFTSSQEEAEWYRMARSHGLTRGMPDKYKNPNVSPDFDFYMLGSNYRSSNLQAYMAALDFDRAFQFSIEKRKEIMDEVQEGLCWDIFYPFCTRGYISTRALYVPLAIPILCRLKSDRVRIEAALKAAGVMTRPIIGGTLLAHTAFKGYGNVDDYPVAKWAHECGFYIGLHPKVTPEMVKRVIELLNTL